MKKLNNLKIKISLFTSIFVIGSFSFGLTSCKKVDDLPYVDDTAYNELIKIRETLKEELKDNKVHTYNEGNENYEFSIFYDNKDYYIDFDFCDTNSHGTQYLTDKFKLAFTDLSNLTGDLDVYLNTFRVPDENGFQNSIHTLIYKVNDNSNAYWNIKEDKIVNGEYTFND